MTVMAMLLLAPLCAGLGYAVYLGHTCWQLVAAARKLSQTPEGRRGSYEARPDRSGMGSQSDFVSETFVPGDAYRAEQLSMARTLIAAGSDPVQVAALLSIPLDRVLPPR
jgi:hypothetical protein